MLQTQRTIPHSQGKKSSVFINVGLFLGILFCVALISSVSFALSATFGRHTTTQTAAAIPPKHVQASLNIIINQPGMKKDWPAYRPSELVVPANSLVTVTIKDTDLGDTLLPKNTPFTSAQGVVGGLAYADGQPYSSLAPDKIAHTFTISQLNINVPLPGDAKNGATSDTITFTFHTGKAGTYLFQCFDPCGQGSSGFEGSMSTKGYMVGTLIVQ
jgi:heme/copper-type cytochrome/quinol oxidase subunit 2